jgi:TATA-box binding protein (TBP) (component of TFIID and TFIIIB)
LIAGQVSHLFTAPGGDDDDAPVGGKRRRRRGGGGGAAAWARLDSIADEIELDTEADFVGTSTADIDGQLQLQREQEIAAAEAEEDATEERSTADDAETDGKTHNSREEDLRLHRLVLARLPQAAGTVQIRQRRHLAKSRVNYGIKAVLDQITEPLYGEHDWITNRDAAYAVVDEDSRAHQQIMKMTQRESRAVPPALGKRQRVSLPVSLEAARFERWSWYSTPKLHTTNVVATFSLGVPVHLAYIISRLVGVSFNPSCFAAVKLCSEAATELVFSGGAVVCAGASSVQMARIACTECTLLLTRVGVQAEVSKFTVQNVVSTGNAGFPVDLFALAAALPLNAHFDPDCFPGCMVRLPKCALVIIIFKSGKCIITGLASRALSLIAWRLFHRLLMNFAMRESVVHESEADYRRRQRQQSSMVQSMCDSVRDMTTAHIATIMQVKNDGAPLDNVFDQVDTHFTQVMNMTRRIGSSYDVEKPEPLDFATWINTTPDAIASTASTSSPVAAEAPAEADEDENGSYSTDDDEDDEDQDDETQRSLKKVAAKFSAFAQVSVDAPMSFIFGYSSDEPNTAWGVPTSDHLLLDTKYLHEPADIVLLTIDGTEVSDASELSDETREAGDGVAVFENSEKAMAFIDSLDSDFRKRKKFQMSRLDEIMVNHARNEIE